MPFVLDMLDSRKLQSISAKDLPLGQSGLRIDATKAIASDRVRLTVHKDNGKDSHYVFAYDPTQQRDKQLVLDQVMSDPDVVEELVTVLNSINTSEGGRPTDTWLVTRPYRLRSENDPIWVVHIGFDLDLHASPAYMPAQASLEVFTDGETVTTVEII